MKSHHLKIIVHLPTTTPFPSHIGASEAAFGDNMEEAKRRAKVVKLEGHFQRKDAFFLGSFEKMVDLARGIVPAHYKDGVVYDIAVNISSSDTAPHVDEHAADGPGGFVVNMGVMSAGVSYFQGAGRDAQKKCYVLLPNTMAGFGGSLRVENTHCVYVLQKSSEPLNFSGEEDAWKLTGPGEIRRVTVTVRFGAGLTPAQSHVFDQLWTDAIEVPGTSAERPETARQTALQKQEQVVLTKENMEQDTPDQLEAKSAEIPGDRGTAPQVATSR